MGQRQIEQGPQESDDEVSITSKDVKSPFQSLRPPRTILFRNITVAILPSVHSGGHFNASCRSGISALPYLATCLGTQLILAQRTQIPKLNPPDKFAIQSVLFS